jgi:hypothetical protein
VNRDRWFDHDTRVRLVDLNDCGGTDQHDPSKVTLVTIPNGVIRTQYWVPNVLLEADVFISVPTFKNHSNGTVTLAMKNLVGCAPNDIYHMPGWNNMKWGAVHSVTNGFPRTVSGPDVPPPTMDENLIVQYSVVDLNLLTPIDFVVVDGLMGVMNGPNATPIQNPTPLMRMIMAGRDPVAVDAIGSLVMGYDPTVIPSIAWADNRTVLGTMDTRHITVAGDHVAAVRYDFPTNHGVESTRADASSPWLDNISLEQGETVSGLVVVTGWGIGDNRSVDRAELTVNGILVDSVVDPSDPFDLHWPAAEYANGPYEVAVTVYDAEKNEAAITRDVVVQVSPDPYIQIDLNHFDHVVWPCDVITDDEFVVSNLGANPLNLTITTDQPWLSASIDAASLLEGEQIAVQVSYDLGGPYVEVPPGVHTGTITISDPNASNNPQKIIVTLEVQRVPADLDGDGDVDQSDFGLFQACLSGPGIPQIDPRCESMRLDTDTDVDIDDFGILQACMSGANVCPDPDCWLDAPQ